MLKLILLFGIVYLVYRFWDIPSGVLKGHDQQHKVSEDTDSDEYIEYEEVD